MKIHIDEFPGDLTPEDIEMLISVIWEHNDEHFDHVECSSRVLRLYLIVDKLIWMLPKDPSIPDNFEERFRRMWEGKSDVKD